MSRKSRHRKGKLTEAPFGLVLNGASVAQSSGRTAIVEKVHIGFEKRRNIIGVGQIKVKIELFLHPAIQRFYNGIVGGSSPSRHGAKYVIIMMGLAKSPRRVDSSLVGVEDYLGCLLFSFIHKLFQFIKAVVIRFIAPGLRSNAVSQDFIVEGIQEERPFPVCISSFEHGHVGVNASDKMKENAEEKM